MTERKQAIRQHLESTRAALIEAVSGLAAEDWERLVHSSEGAWTVRQALAHLASAEAGQLATGQRMLTGEAKLREGWNLDFWNRRQVEKRQDRSPTDLLGDLSTSRRELLEWIDGLSEADLEKSGQHARGDVITIEQLCFRVGEHEADHAVQIRRALEQR